MNKEQFIARLNELLKDVPESERVEAIEYYREYFDDAGIENEERVISELGSPEEVAHNIREELAGRENNKKSKDPFVVALLIALVCILAIPVGVPVVAAIGGTLIGLIAAFLGILLAIWIVGIVFVALSAMMLVLSIANLFTATIAAVVLLGLAFLFFGMGLLLVLAGVKISTALIPTMLRGIAGLFNGIIYRKGKMA